MNIINPTFAYDKLRRSRLPLKPLQCKNMIIGDSSRDGLVGSWGYLGYGSVSASGTVNDRSGNDYTATINGSASVSSDGFLFASSGSYLSVPNTNNVYDGGDYLSFSMWINFTSLPSYSSFISKRSASSPTDYQFGLNSGNTLYWYTGSSYSTTWEPTLGQWYHLVVTCDNTSSTVKFYIDNVLYATFSAGFGTTQSSMPLEIGAHYSSLWENVYGSIDNVRVYNTVLTSDQVSDLYTNGRNWIGHPTGSADYCIGFWGYAASGIPGEWYDRSGWGNTGTLVNNSYVDQLGAYLDGTADYITIPYSSELYPASTVSFSMWIASEDWSTVKTFFSNTQVGGYGARINHDTDEIYFLARLNGTYCTAACTYSEQNLGTASHFAGTCDGRYVKLYINGELVASADAGAYYTIGYSYNLPILIGAEPDASGAPTDSYGYSKGYHDDIRFYNRELSAAEIAAYYNATKGYYQ